MSVDVYDSLDVAKQTFERHRHVNFDRPELDRRLLLLAALAASAGPGGHHAVMDIGGSTGFHRRQVLRYLPSGAVLDWVVVESMAFCQAAAGESHASMTFRPSVQAALSGGFRPGCVYANSSLQYLPDPAGTLEALLATDSVLALVLERTPLRPAGETVTVSQQVVDAAGKPAHARMTLMSRPDLDARLARSGFEVAWLREHRAVWRLGWQWIDTWSLIATRNGVGR